MATIEISHVSKIFKDPKRKADVTALDDMTVEVAKTEFLCLLGASGCGKSTLLNMLAGFEKPTSGTVTVDGQLITAPGSDRGVVFQQANLMPWLPIWENVAFHLLLRGGQKARRRDTAQPYLCIVRLTALLHPYPS